MCGIAGFTHHGHAASREYIERLTGLLFHRGPDHQGVYVAPEICLGAVRLKIIDLEGGDQPMASADGKTVIAFNGEIYNHAAIRAELEAAGVRFRSRCDTEVVLEAFRRYGTACFERLRGMFAVAIWSAADRRLVLARDRAGIKPLYFALRGGEIHFGSELKSIFEHPAIPRELDREALDAYLALNYVPSPRTLVKGIEKLPPGHFLEFRDGRVRMEPFWKLEFTPRKQCFEAAKERLDDLLRSSVREHLVSDAPLGLWSSGGLDSSTILHYAAEAGGPPLKTFSVGFQASCCDERRYFRETAAYYGTDHHEIELGPGNELLDAIEDFTYYSDEPGADAGALPVWFLSRLTARHVTVALSGDGGDELFGGYLTYFADRIARPLRVVPRGLRQAALGVLHRALPVSKRKISFEYKAKRMLEGSLLGADEAHLYWNGSLSREQRRRLLGAGAGRSVGANLARDLPFGVGYLNRYLLLDQRYYLPDNILYKVDRMSMAHSVEVRPALLDHRIVEFAASLPENFKIRGTQGKYILRELMRGKLPPSVLSRPKQGFDIPTHDWFRGFLQPLLLDTLASGPARRSGLLNFAETQRMIRDHMERRINAGYQLWGLLTLFLWLRKWDIETVPAEEYSPALLAAS